MTMMTATKRMRTRPLHPWSSAYGGGRDDRRCPRDDHRHCNRHCPPWQRTIHCHPQGHDERWELICNHPPDPAATPQSHLLQILDPLPIAVFYCRPCPMTAWLGALRTRMRMRTRTRTKMAPCSCHLCSPLAHPSPPWPKRGIPCHRLRRHWGESGGGG